MCVCVLFSSICAYILMYCVEQLTISNSIFSTIALDFLYLSSMYLYIPIRT